MSEDWVIDEPAHAGPEHLDPAFVAGYDKKQGYPDPAEDLAIFEARGLDETSAVVDFAAGTGQFALAAARRFGQVIAIDVSPAMLTLQTERAVGAGLVSLSAVRAGFLSYQHDGPLVDGVYTRNALHQLPDFWKAMALDRIARILKPGGVLRVHDLIYDFGPAEASGIFRRWFDEAAADPAEGYTGADYAEHIRTEFSTFRWLFEPMLAAAGFEIESVEYTRRLYGAYTCVKTSGLREQRQPPQACSGRRRAAKERHWVFLARQLGYVPGRSVDQTGGALRVIHRASAWRRPVQLSLRRQGPSPHSAAWSHDGDRQRHESRHRRAGPARGAW